MVTASWPPSTPPSLVGDSELEAVLDTLRAPSPVKGVPGDGGEITVAEQGLSPLQDDYVSIGAVLDNSSKTLAATAKVEFTVRDARGDDVGDRESFYGSHSVYLPPGGTASLGAGGPLTETGSELNISIKDVEWWPPKQGLGKLTITDLEAAQGFHAETTIELNVDSTVEPAVAAPRAEVLYRDANGKLIGGDYITIDRYGDLVPYGESTRGGELRYGAPKDAATGRTSGYISLATSPPW